jgi:hypothetical protein
MTFYTYIWLREDGTPYYVGKGSGDRAYKSSRHSVNKPEDKSRILVQEFPDEESAFAAEKFLIAYYGRKDLGTGCLRNRSEGGEGSAGVVVSGETLCIRSAYMKKYWSSPAVKQAHRAKVFGQKRSEEVKQLMSQRKKEKGFKFSEESREKMRESAKGNTSRKGTGRITEAMLEDMKLLRSQGWTHAKIGEKHRVHGSEISLLLRGMRAVRKEAATV